MRIRVLDDEERRDWLRLSLTENVGPVTFHALMGKFGSADAVLEALPNLSRKGGLARPLRLCGKEAALRSLEQVNALGARLVAVCEPDYPPLLRMIDGAPPLLCVKGDASLAARVATGIVGARNASAIARKFARQIASEIGAAGFAVVSGLARGIDTAAHEASLGTGTIAVVAGGIDVIYPPENEALQRAIGDRGLLVSEMLPGTVPRAEHFPRRNRIISGIARTTVIVEAAVRSGSLITARYAAEQGREVFAVPGSPLDPRCEGCNKLIRDGATLLLSIQDLLEALASDRKMPHGRLSEPDTPIPDDVAEARDDQRALLSGLLSPSPIDVDDLIRESGLAPSVVAGLLLEFELAGRLVRHSGGMVSRA
ncbi:MAG: DNA-processing protein DprA [Alphaproteobacteria bacterium]|nr:DNA-processing protein DprA [Alphaproteobacteria bacterium]